MVVLIDRAPSFCYYTNVLGRSKGEAEEKRTDDYVSIHCPSSVYECPLL
jgi:hypothetical protein